MDVPPHPPAGNGVFTARQLAGRAGGDAAPRDATRALNVLDRVLFGAVVAAAAVILTVTVVRRTGHDPFVDVEVAPARVESVRIDLNSAAWYDLMLLEGIGETLARRIVADRDTRGPLTSVDELARVPGIGLKTVERIRENATVAGTGLTLMPEDFVPEPPAPPSE